MRALVTGASGFLGSHLVDELLDDGTWDVRVLVRSSSNLRWLKNKDVDISFGDLASSTQDLLASVKGVDVVFHVAGLTKAIWKNRFREVNAEGTKNLLDACTADVSPPEKFILMSSAGAQGPASRYSLCSEKDEPRPVTEYGKSKLAAESIVHQYQDRMDCRIIRPGGIYGPRDMELLPAFQMLTRGVMLRLGLRERIVNMAYVRDITRAALAVARAEVESGEVFLVGGKNASQWEVLHAAAEAVGRSRLMSMALPSPLVVLAAGISSLAGFVSKKPRIFSLGVCRRLLAFSWALDLSKAKNRLGYSPEWDLKEGMMETARWYRSKGLL